MTINWIFFGIYFLLVSAAHIVHVLLIEPVPSSFAYWCAGYTLLQGLLETVVLVILGAWIERHARRWLIPYVLMTFFLLLSHLIDLPLIRFVDMSFWYALHFALQESYANFIELLIASNISIGVWGVLFVSGILVILSGLGFYRLAARYPCRVAPRYLCGAIAALVLAFCTTDQKISHFANPPHFERFTKALPWKTTLFTPPPASLVLEAPLHLAPADEERLSHLDSRAFSLQHQPDIYLFVVESLRHDFITPENAPYLHRFKEENLSFHTTFSNANATHLSWFSLFHSRFPFEWKKESLEPEKQGSLPLRLLKKMGYKIHVSSSAKLAYYQMNKILFGEGEQLADSLFMPDEECDILHERDTAAIDHMLTKMHTPGAGRVFIVFLDATHFDYSWPDEHSQFFPYQEQMNYISALFARERPEPLINRYRNALHFVDSLFGRFYEQLLSTQQGRESVVIFTGDHGEEFYEQGNLFHNSGLSFEQITPPLYYRLGEHTHIKEQVQCDTTCHMDIFPSLFHYLTGEDLMQPVLQGQSIFRENRWPFTLIARFNAGRVPYEYCIHNAENKLIVSIENQTDPLSCQQLKILSRKNVHDDSLVVDANLVQEEFGTALQRLFAHSVE